MTKIENLEIRTRQLTQQRRASLCDNVRDSFSSNTPSFYFAPSISVPKVTTPGSDARISISIAILPPPAGKLYNFAIPDIALLSFSIRVRSYTGLRVLRQSITNPDKPPTSESRTFKLVELDQSKKKFGAVFKPKDGAFDGQACVITIRLPKTILPSFATYNFWRSYRLEGDLTFSIAGKEITTSVQNDLNIVARPEAQVVEGALNGMEDEDEATSLEMAAVMVGAVGVGLEVVSTIVDIISVLGG
jgi:hypothetical protein